MSNPLGGAEGERLQFFNTVQELGTVEPPLTATGSLQRPLRFVLADSPNIDSHLNLPTTLHNGNGHENMSHSVNANDGNIIGVTHIFVDQVRKFNYFSILQKGKGVDSHISPPQQLWNPAFSKDPGPPSERL